MHLTAATIGATSRGFGRRGFQPTFVTLGDVIIQINGKAIKSPSDLYSVLDHTTPGDTLDVTIWNNGTTKQVKIKTE